MIHLILCGGNGSRLWPISRECKPKQFINFSDSKSLLQKTALGNELLCDSCVIVCNDEHYHMASGQLSECLITPVRYILEPTPKNTAAAVCLGLQELDSEAVVLITPADHHIDYSEAYFSAVCQAKKYAEEGQISIFGITPLRPETGFGYIETRDNGWVQCFHEKPDLKTAQTYLNRGHFYWNSGMVCAKAGVLLQAMQKHACEILTASQAAYKNALITPSSSTSTSLIYRIPQESMERIPALSLDYALLEKIKPLRCVLGTFAWSDIGSFDALFSLLPKDSSGNAVDAKNFVSIDSKNNFIMGGQRMISAIDVENLIVIDTPDALLISKVGSTQKVREVVHQLKASTTQLHKTHTEEQREYYAQLGFDV